MLKKWTPVERHPYPSATAPLINHRPGGGVGWGCGLCVRKIFFFKGEGAQGNGGGVSVSLRGGGVYRKLTSDRKILQLPT